MYWIMWSDPNDHSDPHEGFYHYKRGLDPEIWSSVVEKITSKKIWVKDFPKFKGFLYACEQDAINGEYDKFCRYAYGLPWQRRYLEEGKPLWPLGDASVMLRKLAELEFNLNDAATSYICRTGNMDKTE